MNLPDPMVLVGALNSMTKPVISKHTEVTWRTEMVKSTLQLHARPTAEAVTAYHRHLLAEFEALATSQVPKRGEKEKCHASISSHKRGANMEVVARNSMNELSKGDRFKKCLNCGSEEHRAKDCDRPNTAGKSGPKEQNPKPGAQVAQVTPFPSAASTSQPIVQATPVLSPDLLQQAAEMYRQLQAMQVPQATQPLSLPAPQPTQPLPLPAPAPEGSGSQPPPPGGFGASQTPILAAKTRVWEEVKMVGLKTKMATSVPSPPFRLENWDLGQKRDFAPNP